jgi:hypothetical protein
MVKCAKCGTGWTSSGLPLCPICGTRVPAPTPPPDPVPLIEMPAAEPEPESETALAPAPRKNGTAVLPAPVVKKEEPVVAETRLKLLDPSAADIPVQKDLPAPTRPLVGPLVLGSLAFVPALLLPVTVAFEATRVLGVLGFCMAGFFAPFAPIAWIVGLVAERRRRDQGLRPERSVTLGRTLGQAATMVLVGELTVGLIAISALRLSGRFPSSFWQVF